MIYMPFRKHQEQTIPATVIVSDGKRISLISLSADGKGFDVFQAQTNVVNPVPIVTAFTAQTTHMPTTNELQNYCGTANSMSMSTVAGVPSTVAASLKSEKVAPTILSGSESETFGSADEKGHYIDWEGHKDDVLPEKSHPKPVRNLRYIVMSLYRRLFSMVFLINLGFFIAVAINGGIPTPKIATVVMGNLMVAILMRQDYVVNILFNIACSIPQSWPLFIRRICAKIYTIGGIHSGCAASAVIWFTYLSMSAFTSYVLEVLTPSIIAVRLTIDAKHQNQVSVGTLVITYVINCFLFGTHFYRARYRPLTGHDRRHRDVCTSCLPPETARQLRTNSPFRRLDRPHPRVDSVRFLDKGYQGRYSIAHLCRCPFRGILDVARHHRIHHSPLASLEKDPCPLASPQQPRHPTLV